MEQRSNEGEDGSSSSETFTTGRQDARGGAVSPGPAVDVDRLADQVYQIIERRLIVEKESRGL
jgi:hypothetical protein